MEYHNKRYCQGVPQTKVLPVSVTIKRAAKANHYQNYRQAIREYHNQKKCQGYHNQYDWEGVSQLKGIPGSITVKITAR